MIDVIFLLNLLGGGGCVIFCWLRTKEAENFFTHATEGTGSEDWEERSVFCFAMLA